MKKLPYTLVNADGVAKYLHHHSIHTKCSLCGNDSLSVQEVKATTDTMTCSIASGTYANQVHSEQQL